QLARRGDRRGRPPGSEFVGHRVARRVREPVGPHQGAGRGDRLPMRNVMKTPRKIVRTLGDRRGFTLVEVLVASMILVVALLTLASMFPMGYRQITDAGRMTVAVSGARHILEARGY